MWSVPQSWSTPAESSLFGRFLGRRAWHPQEFDCAVRVIAGDVPGESGRWRYRRSAVDPLVVQPGVVALTHGHVTLRLRFTGPAAAARVRPYHRVWVATELTSGAVVEVAADAGEAGRFALEP